MAGCSYNPDDEAHQEALGYAVADEMTKRYKKELAPRPPPPTVNAADYTDLELHSLQALDAPGDTSSDDDDDGDENGAALARGDDDGAGATAARRRAVDRADKLKRSERNRQLRAAAQAREEAARKKLKEQRRALEALPALEAEVAEREKVRSIVPPSTRPSAVRWWLAPS